MTTRAGNCPSCGAPVAFAKGGAIVVCEFCSTVVARGDFALEDLGKVADVADSGSPLQVGLRGKWKDAGFELTGRAQLAHSMGGTWDEWYARFDDGRWGWLAEAQGKFFLTFERNITGEVPGLADLVVGAPIPGFTGGAPLVVSEKGTAKAVAAEGEIPYRLVPNAELKFADLSGPGGAFATLDYSGEKPAIYAGEEVSLDALGVAKAAAPERETKHVGSVRLACPQCDGALELRAPDETQRVACPQCGSLLDVKGTKLELLHALSGIKWKPVIPIGKKGRLRDADFTVIGAMRRSVTIEDERFFWEEYLLYEPRVGFRWLVRSDAHWSFVEPVPAGDVRETSSTAVHAGTTFKAYSRIHARVEHVLGEFLWKVTTGETVKAADFIAPPFMLSKEVTLPASSPEQRVDAGPGERAKRLRDRLRDRAAARAAGKDADVEEHRARGHDAVEVNWSRGTYTEPEVVEAAFGVSLDRPSRTGAIEPFRHKRVYKYWAGLVAFLVLSTCCVLFSGNRRTALAAKLDLAPIGSGVANGARTVFTQPFTLGALHPVKVKAVPGATLGSGWLYVNGELVKGDAVVHRFAVPKSWQSADDREVTLSSVDAGTYTMRLEAHWEHGDKPALVDLEVVEDSADPGCGCCTFFALSLAPIFVGIWHLSFESRRWQDSYFEDQA